jgi:hypothetical protein
LICTIFFIDEDQRVTPSDIRSKQAIQGFTAAKGQKGNKGAEAEAFELASQFRCSGSDGYFACLDNGLQNWETANNRPANDEYAVKAGRSASGQKATSSHTGALANEDRTVDAFFRHHGIWRVRDPHTQALAAEAYLKGW